LHSQNPNYDKDRGVSFLQQAADNGSSRAMIRLAMFSTKPGDQGHAFKLFRAASDLKNPRAKAELALFYSHDWGVVKKNLERAPEFFSQSEHLFKNGVEDIMDLGLLYFSDYTTAESDRSS
jgi:TPR repeat protein